jgi:hypothetical protein
VPPQGTNDVQQALHLSRAGMVGPPVQRRTEVRVLLVEPAQPSRLPPPRELRPGRRYQGEAPRRVLPPGPYGVAARLRLLRGLLPDGFQQPEARLALQLVPTQQALVHE